MSRSAPLLVPTLAVILTAALPAFAQDPGSFYDSNCAPCHSIGGGDQGGPDLKGVTTRRERQWLIRFVTNPEGMVASGDATAVAMVRHFDGAVMPSTPGLTPQLAEALLRYIEQKSEGTGAAPPEPTPAFTKADVVRGRALFTGAVRTAQGAPACITCHAAADRGGLAGGGRLGRDLTQVSVRLRGPAGVARWLESPPTPMMRALVRRAPLTADENRALTAFFEDLRTRPESSANRQMGRLAAAGVVGALLGLAAIAGAWRGRLRSVRRPLVERCAASLRTGGDS